MREAGAYVTDGSLGEEEEADDCDEPLFEIGADKVTDDAMVEPTGIGVREPLGNALDCKLLAPSLLEPPCPVPTTLVAIIGIYKCDSFSAIVVD